jgi:hypothetical protein
MVGYAPGRGVSFDVPGAALTHPTSSQPTNAYGFQIAFPFVESQSGEGTFAANVLVFDINGIEFVPLPNIDVLLGRDIICKGVFVRYVL